MLAAVSTAFVTAAGNILNDLGDRVTDRQNHPDRPLVTGAISVSAARAAWPTLVLAAALLIVPVALAFPLIALLLAVAVALVVGYERRAKARGLWGNASVALLTGLVFLYGGAAVGNAVVMLPFAAMAFFATLSRELIKDMEDAEGDVDRVTVPRRYGPVVATRAARAAVLAAIVLSAVPFFVLVVPSSAAGIMYGGLVGLADAVFLVSVAFLPERLHWEQTMSKVAMAVALVAFLATAFR